MPSRLSLVSITLLASSALMGGAVAQTPSIELDTVVVEGATGTGTGGGGSLTTNGYVPRATTVGTKTDTDIRKIPQSIGTVSREELEDRNVQSLVEAARYTSGVRAGQFGFDPRFDTLFIRGFDVTNIGYYRDGLRSLGGTFSVFRHEPYLLEGVTILKGPSSVLYGAGSPGGLVNVISKRPTDVPFRELEAQYGSFGRVQGNYDLSGPVGENDNILYRLTGIWRSADTDLVAARDDRISVAPAVTFRSDDRNTHFTLLGEYTDFTSGGAAGFRSENNRITPFQEGDPNYRDYDGEQWRIGYEFEHRFSDALSFRQNLRYQEVDADLKYVSILNLGDGITAPRSATRLIDRSDSVAVDNQLQAELQTGAIAHTILGGLDYTYLDTSWGYSDPFPAPSLDLRRLNYGEQPIGSIPRSAVPTFYETKQEQIGLYLQDQAEYERFVLTLGGRYDWLKNDQVVFGDRIDARDEEFTGRAGLAYLFDNGISPYVSYSTSFAPTTGANATTGLPFSPTKGEQEEIGVRYTPDDLDLSLSAAIFRLRQSNTVQTVGLNQTVQTGERRSQGLELSATAALTDAFSMTASYTYLDMEIREEVNRGNMPAGIPDHQFSAWGNYEFLGGPLQGLGLGLGVRYIGSSYADDTNTRRNGERALVDAAVSYEFGALNPNLDGIRAQVNADNLFDEQRQTCTGFYCYREEGRNVIGSLRLRF